jgi:hypothetical protein
LWCYIRLLIHFIQHLSLVQNSEGRCKAVSGLEGDKETSTSTDFRIFNFSFKYLKRVHSSELQNTKIPLILLLVRITVALLIFAWSLLNIKIHLVQT